jgi:hypothetical protein
MDTISLENYLASLQRMAERYFRQLNEVFEPNSECQHNKESIEGASANASAAASDTRERLNNRLNAICDIYLTTTDTERAELRSNLGTFPTLLNALHQYIGWCQRQITKSEDRVCLRRALAAASWEDNRTSYKEMYAALGSLWETCIKVGLDPSMEFVSVGYLSNPEQGGTKTSMRDFLIDFEKSAFFGSDVQPKL